MRCPAPIRAQSRPGFIRFGPVARPLAIGLIAFGLAGCASLDPIVDALLKTPSGPVVAETPADRRAPVLLARSPDPEQLATIAPAAGGAGHIPKAAPTEDDPAANWVPAPDDVSLRHIDLAPVMFSIILP